MIGGYFSQRLALLLAALWLLVPGIAHADPADVNAAARGVVRVVILKLDGDQVTPVSHGTGFAVSGEQVITNAHVIAEAQNDPTLTIGLVPSDGGDAVYGRIVAVDARRDLALITTTSPMHLPALTISGNSSVDSGTVTAVGYPMNVDRAQGLSLTDIFHAQPPVKSTGTLSGRRPARDFDSLLHTAPIARGSSGGPLLDECGRVLGVNSFGTDSGSADAEFYFAVSTRELLPFLRANKVSPRVNSAPCRSLAELDAQERAAADRAQLEQQARTQADQQRLSLRKEQLRREAEFALLAERDDGMALAMVLLIAGMGAAGLAVHAHHNGLRHNAEVGFVLAGLAFVAAAIAWETRPQFTDIDDKIEQMLREGDNGGERSATAGPGAGQLVCVVDPQRSRITGADTDDIPLKWSAAGCVNDRTQYGQANGSWSRIFVPAQEELVSINRFDPQTREYRVERYLLDRASMVQVRKARGDFQAPACGAGDEAVRDFGARQQSVAALLPSQPNERLVYHCTAKG